MALLVLCTGILAGGRAQAAPAETKKEPAVSPVTMAMSADAEAAVRLSPEENSEELGRVRAGQAVNACGRTDTGWIQIVYGSRLGYVSEKLLSPIPADEAMLAALSAQAAFVKQNAAPAPDETPSVPEEDETPTIPEEDETPSAAEDKTPAVPAEPVTEPGFGNVIFVGDSRTGQMANAVGGPAAWPGTAFAACFGGGVEWLSAAPAKKEIDQYVTPGSIIIINYGVNDLSKHNQYIETINKYNREWREKGAVVYFATVGPVGENEYGKRNWAVEYFNNQLTGRLDGSIGRIDLYGYLVATGYTPTPDGMHYTADTYSKIFQFLMQSVGKL